MLNDDVFCVFASKVQLSAIAAALAFCLNCNGSLPALLRIQVLYAATAFCPCLAREIRLA